MKRRLSWSDVHCAIRAWKNRATVDRSYYQGMWWRCFVVNHDVLMAWTREFRLEAWISIPEDNCKDRGLVLHLGFIQIVIRWPWR